MAPNLKHKLSIVVPYHDMKNAEFFLKRNIDSIMSQTFSDYEIVLTKEGSMPENTNRGIKRARGELIKILYLDDYLAHKDALKDIAEAFTGHWLVTGTDNNPIPYWTDDIETGNNKLGSPSSLTVLNDSPLLFDEEMTWLLDCDYYKRMHDLYGEPVILEGVNVNIGVHEGQVSNLLTDKEKHSEQEYMKQKYG